MLMQHTSFKTLVLFFFCMAFSACGSSEALSSGEAEAPERLPDLSSYADTSSRSEAQSDGVQGESDDAFIDSLSSLDSDGQSERVDVLSPMDSGALRDIDASPQAPDDASGPQDAVSTDAAPTDSGLDTEENIHLNDLSEEGNEEVEDTSTPPSDSDDEPQGFLESYGTLETLAGSGLIGGKAVNGWLDSYEGAQALNVELSRPHMTLADAQGRLYIADKDAHAIRRIDLDGTIHTIAGVSQPGNGPDQLTLATEVPLHSPNGIWVQPDGRAYVLDLGNGKIRKLHPDGMMETMIDVGQLGTGRGLWVSEDEDLAWISAGSVLKRWTPDGGVENVASDFVSLGNIARLPSGQVARMVGRR